MSVDYKKRVVDQILLDKLNAKGGVVIEGSKWCGKQQRQCRLPVVF